jgi:hypothetical protein
LPDLDVLRNRAATIDAVPLFGDRDAPSALCDLPQKSVNACLSRVTGMTETSLKSLGVATDGDDVLRAMAAYARQENNPPR